jgi:hypothetical protein
MARMFGSFLRYRPYPLTPRSSPSGTLACKNGVADRHLVTAHYRRQWPPEIGEDEEIVLTAAAQSHAHAKEVHLVFALSQQHWNDEHPIFVVLHTLDML